MPKIEIDYSNTIIYKITCKNPSISDLYVGHTTNFVQRKHSHKQGCINEKSSNYKCKLYEVIRNNGGWENWKMEIINFFECKNQYEARKKEQEYFLSLNATLNSIEPYAIHKPKDPPIIKNTIIKEVLYCKECNKNFNNKELLNTHNQTNKHIKKIKYQSFENTMALNKSPNISTDNSVKIFLCNYCNITCSNKKDYNKHLNTRKHQDNLNGNKCNPTNPLNDILTCLNCEKIYKSRVGLWRHKKNCKEETNNIVENIIIDSSLNEIKVLTDLVLELVKSNNELQKQVLEICKNNNHKNGLKRICDCEINKKISN